MEYILFDKLPTVYHDRNGNVIADISGRSNKFGVDEFYGVNRYPQDHLDKCKIIGQWQRESKILLQLDVTDQEANDIVNKKEKYKKVVTRKVKRDGKKFKSDPDKSIEHNFQDFNPVRLSDEEAKTVKKEVFNIIEP